MTFEGKQVSVFVIAAFVVGATTAILMAHANRPPVPKPCPPPPACTAAVVEVGPITTPEPKDPPVEPLVPVTPGEWEPTTDFGSLAGVWQDSQKRPVPTFELVTNRQGSKTPFNLKWRTETLTGGCGFDAEHDAWCITYKNERSALPVKSRQHLVFFTRDGLKQLKVTAVTNDGKQVVTLFDLELVRAQ